MLEHDCPRSATSSSLVTFRYLPVRPRMATSCSCRFLALDYFPRLLSPWYMALPEPCEHRRGGLPLRALTRQPVESFPWDKLQTVPLPYASQKRRAFKGTADSKLRVWIITVNLREYRMALPEISGTVSNLRITVSIRPNSTYPTSTCYVLYHTFQTILVILNRCNKLQGEQRVSNRLNISKIRYLRKKCFIRKL